MLTHLETRFSLLKDRFGRRGMLAISALSLLWGVISGFWLKRDYAHSRQLLAYLGLLVLASAAFRIWLEYARRLTTRAAEVSGIRRFLLTKPSLVEGVAHFGTQCAVQYITMFVIPLQVLASAWLTLGITAVLTVVTLVDPWWVALARQPWRMAVVRSFTAVLAASFAFPVLLPEQLSLFYPCLGLVALVAALPWHATVAWQWPPYRQWLPALLVGTVVVAEATLHSWLRIPLLSIWLKDPALGIGIADHHLLQEWEQEEDAEVLANAADDGVCCFTPIVSPSGVNLPVTHEWLVNGSLVGRIGLSPIQGLGSGATTVNDGNNHGFRTFSCKHHLPSGTIKTISCRVYLDQDLYLGMAEVSFR